MTHLASQGILGVSPSCPSLPQLLALRSRSRGTGSELRAPETPPSHWVQTLTCNLKWVRGAGTLELGEGGPESQPHRGHQIHCTRPALASGPPSWGHFRWEEDKVSSQRWS